MQIMDLVSSNRYKVEEKTKFLSRCIDGRYKDKLKDQNSKIKTESNTAELPALAIPGADAGELALIFATANVYGFKVDEEKVLKSLIEIVGGEKNFSFHSDHHGDPKIPASGCGHLKQMNFDLKSYNLEKEQMVFIRKSLSTLKKKGTEEIILEGEHLEGAVLQVKGRYGIYPRYFLEIEGGSTEVQVFVFHSTLVNQRHRMLVSTLLKNKAVKLSSGCDDEYLYEVLSETTENHLFETAKRLASGLPIYLVEFAEDGNFIIKEMGKII